MAVELKQIKYTTDEDGGRTNEAFERQPAMLTTTCSADYNLQCWLQPAVLTTTCSADYNLQCWL